MQLKENSQNKESLQANKRLSISRVSSGSITPRRKIKVIKQFSQARYGVPIDTQILEIDASNQSAREVTGYDMTIRTKCPSCRQQTQNVQTQKCGKTACIWFFLLSPCCLCLLPIWFQSCKDVDKKCVQCWQTKKRVAARFCFCQ